MRIEQGVIDEIKRRNDLVSFIRPYVAKLQKTGKVYTALCPFHSDTKRSFFIDPAKQLWNCLGACSAGKGSGGDIISFARKYHGWSFHEAVERLSPPRPVGVPEDIRRKVPAILSQVIDVYHRSYLESRSAAEYISSRGIDPAVAKQYKAGYVDGSLLERVARDSSDWKLLQEIGIITEAGNEHFRTCVVFPLTAFNSFPQDLYGRAIGKDLHLYLPGPRRGLFNWQHAKNFTEIILAESVIDALSFIQCGYLNVLPIYGVNGFTQDHVDFFIRHRTKKVIFALDSDEAGRMASQTIRQKLEKMHLATQIIELPAADPNELLQKEGVERFKLIVEELLKKETSSTAAVLQSAIAIPQFEAKEGELAGDIEDRHYSIRGIPKKSYSKMRLAVKIAMGESSYLDSVDLISMRNRAAFAGRAAGHFDLPKPIIEKDLLAILDAIDGYQKQPEEAGGPAKVAVEISESGKAEAFAFLRCPNLLDLIASDMEALGYVGEEANKKLGYLGSISRFLDEPFSIVILSQSGSGKSYMADVLVRLTAPEDVKMYSRLTPAALFYMGAYALSHKFIVIEEKTGSEAADYSIRALQSKHELSIAVTIKNPETGKMQTVEIKVYGPTAFLETTTASRINYENSTRCYEMYLDESTEQTERIHRMQRFLKTVEGRSVREKQQAICKKHHNAQRLLKQVCVVIPYAPAIEFPASWLRTRRDHQRFLNLIEVIAFLHQYRKEVKKDPRTGGDYIEADLSDYEIAAKLAADILPENLSDLKKPVSDLKEAIERYLADQAARQKLTVYEIPFTRRAIREETGLPNQRIKDLFRELEELEYVEVEKSPRGGAFLYRLVSGKNGAHQASLLTAGQLKEKLSGNGSRGKVVEVEQIPTSGWKAATAAALRASGRVDGRRT